MLEPIVSFFEKLIENFSWRRLLLLFAILTAAIGSGVTYEGYTSSFRLARMEKQIALLEQLAKVTSLPSVQADSQLKQAGQNLKKQLTSTTSSSDVEYELLPWGKKVLSTAIVWLVFSIFLLFNPSLHSNPQVGPFTTMLGVVVVAAPFIALSAAVPTFQLSWLNYVVYPIGHLLLLMAMILWWQKRARQRAIAKFIKAQRASQDA